MNAPKEKITPTEGVVVVGEPIKVTDAQASAYYGVRDNSKVFTVDSLVDATQLDAIYGAALPPKWQTIATKVIEERELRFITATAQTWRSSVEVERALLGAGLADNAPERLETAARLVWSSIGGATSNGATNPNHPLIALAFNAEHPLNLTKTITAERVAAADVLRETGKNPLDWVTKYPSLAEALQSKGVDSVAELSVHELAHQIDFWLRSTGKLSADALRIDGMLRQRLIKLPLSEYSEAYDHELFTEHFVLYTLAPDAYRANWPEVYDLWQSLMESIS